MGEQVPDDRGCLLHLKVLPISLDPRQRQCPQFLMVGPGQFRSSSPKPEWQESTIEGWSGLGRVLFQNPEKFFIRLAPLDKVVQHRHRRIDLFPDMVWQIGREKIRDTALVLSVLGMVGGGGLFLLADTLLFLFVRIHAVFLSTT
jgi:hypothetical protein